MKVLVVDDCKSIRTLVAECAKDLGHEVFYAENGDQAIKCVEKCNVDLILMDIEMPGKNGFEITSEIRAMKGIDWFPIIFISTKIDDNSFAKGILSGGDAYVQKPINLVRVQLTIKAMERIYITRQKLQIAQKELLIANKELERFALFDQLTGLANRRNFDETFRRQFLLAKRNKNPLTLMMCDIDFFKNFNDHYGHQQGDECLAAVANIISDIPSRPTDTACRYGGEEFTVILPDTNLLGGSFVAEKLRQAVVDAAIKHEKSEVLSCVTLSVGFSTYTGQFNTEGELLKAADDALYRAKEKGRNRIGF
ncbi:MAG: diguanylate cyclase [Methylococcales bacterium]|nr:diguanylate cyclase [Methylococcales bacterium]